MKVAREPVAEMKSVPPRGSGWAPVSAYSTMDIYFVS
jgi:hypothetical protein